MSFTTVDLRPDFHEASLTALVSIDSVLRMTDSTDHLVRSVNFMYYELASQCEGRSSDDVFTTLNDFFFHNKKFRVAGTPVLLSHVVETRTGCGAALALLYIHLGQQLGLKLELVHWPLHSIVKWECQGKCNYVDLGENGKVLSEDELLQMINRHKDQVQSLTTRDAVLQYLTYLTFYYRQEGELESLHKALCIILTIEPENMRYLAERALLRREMGLIKDALQDMKRYFSFNDEGSVRHELIHIYEELKSRAPALT